MSKTTLIGILNITPDSFSDGGEYFGNVNKAVSRVEKMLQEGADIIDVGGESTRPGSDSVSPEEELRRVIPVIKAINQNLGDSVDISIDTNKSEVARQALVAGASMVNSLGGFQFDEKLAHVIYEFNCKIVIYHIKGLPKTMQTGEITYSDVISEISEFFKQQIQIGKKNDISKSQFILDPGIGFGKRIQHNVEIIKRLSEFLSFRLPIMIGVSRKSHLGMLLQQKLELRNIAPTNARLEASLAETAVAVMNGTTMIRTHDVLETKKFLTILEEFIPNSP